MLDEIRTVGQMLVRWSLLTRHSRASCQPYVRESVSLVSAACCLVIGLVSRILMAVHQPQQQQFGCGFAGDFVTATRADYVTSQDFECRSAELTAIGSADVEEPTAGRFVPTTRINDDEEFIYASQPIKLECDVCSSCDLPIQERVLLTVNGRTWHEQCLRCASCSKSLNSQPSCYYKDSNFFCKQCYSRQLSTGEEFALQEGRLLCKQHFVELVEGESGVGQQKQKTKRVRTTFAEEQLSVLQAHFQIDSNPDGADLERIANMTGLSKRVTQVWFQNSRARQKKYQGNRKGTCGGASGEETEGSRRSSEGPLSPGQKSETSSDGLMYPTSVTTSAEEAMTESTVALTSLQFD
ncbi:unnamed protein product [Caenorhabditis auriculariae]|uniref:LIM/homeobox protein Awh n=1 Tax=Caenorhabditis auriculariae TaxID=2777116 RepID=A0A8S1GP40_9PELO|nr:unnamed protein product [Caenorhabditis auriculariae]